ncbi:hypothetical protein RIF29_21842 [Crotalaria pallida]|uniref:Uncharacterized protein n=1 Tax=Crotalaria pallida TaxID=3830 RepID=A0AAN9IDU2_CROPI
MDVETFRFTPITHRGTDKSTAIFVKHYSLNRDLYHVTLIDLSNSNDDQNDDVTIFTSKLHNASFGKHKRLLEKGESYHSNKTTTPFVYEICIETKTRSDKFLSIIATTLIAQMSFAIAEWCILGLESEDCDIIVLVIVEVGEVDEGDVVEVTVERVMFDGDGGGFVCASVSWSDWCAAAGFDVHHFSRRRKRKVFRVY